MTAAPAAGATSHAALDWHAIKWQEVHRNVRRLQVRIVKALQAGRWGKVKALQHLLTHSFSAKSLAIRRVTENPGKRTPGVDQVIWDSPAKKASAIGILRQHGYKAQPLRRVPIPKPNGKMRPLGIPTMRDRAMQALYLLSLDPIAETTGDPNSYGFRSHRCTADAIEQCRLILSRKTSARWVLEADIKSCFDSIPKGPLLARVAEKVSDGTFLDLIQRFLDQEILDGIEQWTPQTGVPQGSVLSPLLSNLYLHPLDGVMSQTAYKAIRYCDDLVVLCRTQAEAESALDLIRG